MSGCDLGCGVGEQLTQLSQQISDCHADVCVVKASQLSVKEAVRLHDMELQGRSGNGQSLGLKGRVVKLEASQKTLSAGLSLINVEAAKRHARMMQGLWAIGCGLLLALCEGAIGLLVWLLS